MYVPPCGRATLELYVSHPVMQCIVSRDGSPSSFTVMADTIGQLGVSYRARGKVACNCHCLFNDCSFDDNINVY